MPEESGGLKKMNLAMLAALESFLHGFGASAVILPALVGAIYFAYKRSKKNSSADIEKNSYPPYTN